MDGRKVVVKTTLSVETRGDGKMFAGRLTNLGLTAYGRTEEEAKDAVKLLFNKMINEYRERSILEKRLNGIAVEWYWFDEYHDSDIPLEDTSPGTPPARAASGTNQRWSPTSGIMVMAA